jgi:hypothetical protein
MFIKNSIEFSLTISLSLMFYSDKTPEEKLSVFLTIIAIIYYLFMLVYIWYATYLKEKENTN